MQLRRWPDTPCIWVFLADLSWDLGTKGSPIFKDDVHLMRQALESYQETFDSKAFGEADAYKRLGRMIRLLARTEERLDDQIRFWKWRKLFGSFIKGPNWIRSREWTNELRETVMQEIRDQEQAWMLAQTVEEVRDPSSQTNGSSKPSAPDASETGGSKQ